jgi:hypothetical protein
MQNKKEIIKEYLMDIGKHILVITNYFLNATILMM